MKPEERTAFGHKNILSEKINSNAFNGISDSKCMRDHFIPTNEKYL